MVKMIVMDTEQTTLCLYYIISSIISVLVIENNDVKNGFNIS
jgi:hypothetical protein